MSTRTILSYVGLAVGTYFGNPQLGWAIGSAIGNAVDPEVIKGPSIGDIANQTSQEGIPRPIVFGLSQPMAGNIIASGEPRIVRKRQRQGKGGPKVETESVYRTYAIGICEGPITRVVRVWRNGELVYDRLVFDPEFLIEQVLDGMRERMSGNNQTFAQRSRFFLGTWDQMPSPDLEAEFGVGNVGAHRGTAYMVMDDEDLTDLRGAIPQYQFQVERCEGNFLTSKPYPVHDYGALNSGGRINEVQVIEPPREALDIYGFVNIAEMPELLKRYTDWPAEALDSSGEIYDASLVEGAPVIIEIENQEPEALDSSGEVVSGTLEDLLVRYEIDPEALDISGAIVAATLE